MNLTYTNINIESVRFRVAQAGSGMPVLLVHGFPLNHEMWHAQIDALADQYHVIAPDLRGFGGSEIFESTFTMTGFAEDLARILEQLDITQPIAFCGFSMGGYILWEFWKQYANRVRALILCDTRAAADSEQVARGRQQMAARVLNEGVGFIPEVMLPKLLAPQTFENQQQVVEKVRKLISKSRSDAVAAAQRAMALRDDSQELLSQIKVPTLLIVGEEDVISTTLEMKAMSQSIPNADLQIIADAGHMSPMENPSAVNQAMRQFLASIQ